MTNTISKRDMEYLEEMINNFYTKSDDNPAENFVFERAHYLQDASCLDIKEHDTIEDASYHIIGKAMSLIEEDEEDEEDEDDDNYYGEENNISVICYIRKFKYVENFEVFEKFVSYIAYEHHGLLS